MNNSEKVQKFLDAYGELVKEHNVDFVTFPQFVPDGQGGFRVVCQTIPIDMEEQKKAQTDGGAFISK